MNKRRLAAGTATRQGDAISIAIETSNVFIDLNSRHLLDNYFLVFSHPF